MKKIKKMNKKGMLVVLTLVVLISAFFFLFSSNFSDYLSTRVFYEGQTFEGGELYLGSSEGQPGENVSVNVVLSNSNAVAGFNLDIKYDPKVLKNPTAKGLSSLESAKKSLSTSTPSEGIFRIIVFGFGEEILSNDNLIQVSFDIKSDASDQESILELVDLAVADINAEQIYLDNNDGKVVVKLADTSSPVLSNGSPSETLSVENNQTNISLTTNESAICKYSATKNTAYTSMLEAFSTTGGINHVTSVINLQNKNQYTFYVRCQDSAENANTTDFVISFFVDQGKEEPVPPAPPAPPAPLAPVEPSEEEPKPQIEQQSTENHLEQLTQQIYSISRPEVRVRKTTYKFKNSTKKIYISEKKPKFRGETSNLKGGEVKIYVDDKKVKEVGIKRNGTWSKKIKFTDNKVYDMRFTYFDANNEEVASEKYKIEIDTENPEFINLPGSLNKKRGDRVWFQAIDNDKLNKFVANFNGKKYKIKKKSSATTFSFNIPQKTSKGVYVLEAKVYDMAGNKAIRRVTIKVQ